MSIYQTIVADPPWKVSRGRPLGIYEIVDGKQIFKSPTDKARPLAYPQMSVDEIAALQVPSADNAHLYLWTINKYIEHAFHVARVWGFKYSTLLTWAKKPMGGGLGGCYGISAEYVLFARKGKLQATSRIGRSWFDWKRPYDERGKPKHSAKPPEFFEMVEQVSPGPYLEMFARQHREGWHSWGNEIESHISIKPN